MAPCPRASATVTLLFARDRAAGAMRRAAYLKAFARFGIVSVGTQPAGATVATAGRR